MYKVFIDKVKVFAYHGVFEHEKARGQDFVISAVVNFPHPPISDDLSAAADYSAAFSLIKDIASDNTFDLVETLASRIADELLLLFQNAVSAHVCVEKPDAPIEGSFQSVGAEVTKYRVDAYLSLGSNLLLREENLKKALKLIGEIPGIKIRKVSKVYETSPVGYLNQGAFLNCCIKIFTTLSAHQLLSAIQSVEEELGRRRSFKDAPRIIDVDIILYDSLALASPELTLPHPRMLERKFVLVPLLDIYDSSAALRLMFTNAFMQLMGNDTVEPVQISLLP